MKKFIVFGIFILLVQIVSAQSMRYGSCKNVGMEDRFYVSPYVGLGSASITTLGVKTKQFTYMGGIDLLYNFQMMRIGVGARFQAYDKFQPHNYFKPYLAFEVPIYFDEFSDFGVFADFGMNMNFKENISGPFTELGIFYNFVLNSYSGLYLGLDYGIGKINSSLNSATIENKITEFKLRIAYRMWF